MYALQNEKYRIVLLFYNCLLYTVDSSRIFGLAGGEVMRTVLCTKGPELTIFIRVPDMRMYNKYIETAFAQLMVMIRAVN